MTQPMRLAFRVEGREWVCYCAMTDTMEGAIRMGSIAMGAVESSEIKQGFMALMMAVLTDALQQKFKIKIESWGEPESAPESERSGSA